MQRKGMVIVMNKTDVSVILNQDHRFRLINALAQHWREKKYSYKKIPRPDFGLMCILRGGVDFVMEEQTLSVREGDVVFLPKGSHYEAVFIGETEDALVNFDGEDLPACRNPLLLLKDTPSFASFFEALLQDATANLMQSLRALAHFYLLLDALAAQNMRNESPESMLVERVCRYLQSEEDLSVVAIAKRCAISESGLRRIFKARMGMTPLAYRRAYRLKEAKYLLENTDLSLAEIAERLRFFDAAYFSHVFRRAFGITPGDYAKEKKMTL